VVFAWQAQANYGWHVLAASGSSEPAEDKTWNSNRKAQLEATYIAVSAKTSHFLKLEKVMILDFRDFKFLSMKKTCASRIKLAFGIRAALATSS
jgi:hypothetical protein